MDIELPNYKEDKQAINEMLRSGAAVVHHSQAYEDAYQPHYRIVGVEALNKINYKLQNTKNK
jgi:hypothetical protein